MWLPSPNARKSSGGTGVSRRPARAFSLLEVLIVVVLLGILVALAVPYAQSTVEEQLEAGAQLLASHLAYARSLAVTYGDSYRVRFLLEENRYVLEYAGDDPQKQTLPSGPLDGPNQPAHQRIVEPAQWPTLGQPIRLFAVQDDTGSDLTEITFGPLGSTQSDRVTLIWLTAGQDAARRYVAVTVQPVTGAVSVAEAQSEAP